MRGERSEHAVDNDLIFRARGSMIAGLVALVVIAVAVPFMLGEGSEFPAWGAALALLLAVVGWTVMVRPRVRVDREEIELRGPLETVHVPLAAITRIEVRQALVIEVGECRFVNVAVGRTRRQTAKENVTGAGRPLLMRGPLARGEDVALVPSAPPPPSFGASVEQRLRRRAEDARLRHGIAPDSREQSELAGQVRRQRAWPEIALLSVAAVALAVVAAL